MRFQEMLRLSDKIAERAVRDIKSDLVTNPGQTPLDLLSNPHHSFVGEVVSALELDVEDEMIETAWDRADELVYFWAKMESAK